MKAPKLMVVIPCLNEEAVLERTGKQIGTKLEEMERQGSIAPGSSLLFVDDHSSDGSWERISGLARRDRRIRGISLGCRSGQQLALMAGMLHVRKECDICITMDCDGQDDPEIMESMVETWKQGSQIVYGVRKNRRTDGWLKRVTAEGYYDLLAFLGVDVVKNHGDFRLLGREVLEELARYPESSLFLRGLLPRLGFAESCVYYERGRRRAGKSRYTPGKMMNLGMDGIAGFTIRPLRLAFLAGTGAVLGGLACGAFCLAAKIQGRAVPELLILACMLCFFSGMQFLCLGVLGEYLGRLSLEGRRRPRYRIARETAAEGEPEDDGNGEQKREEGEGNGK